MNNAIELLEELDQYNIKITVDDGDLNIKAPQGTLTPELKKHLREHKSAVMSLLGNNAKNQKSISSIDRTDSLSLSFAQQRLWFLNQFEGGADSLYNIPWALRLSGSLDIPALEKAFNAIIERHENLRTCFQSGEEQATQVIIDKLTLPITVIDIAEESAPDYIRKHSDHLFDLTTAPLIKVELLRLQADEHILLINMHHIISDGWSIGVLNQELSSLYTAYVQGRPSPLSPLPIQYADFAHWQRQWLQGEVLDQKIDYWKEQLTGAPALLELPTDRPRPIKQSYRGSLYKFNLPTELAQGLKQLSRKAGSTLFMTLLAGFNILLARYSGQSDICVGSPIANRQRHELEGLIGFFVNTLILRTQLAENTSFKALLQQVKETSLTAYAHQDIPFEHLVEALNPERSLSYSPLFQVMFILQNNTHTDLCLPDVEASPIDYESHSAKFDLTMALEESDTGIEGVIEYSTDLFDQSTIERLCQHYQVLLEGIVENPNQSIGTLPLLSEPEKQQLLVDWNQTEAPYPRDRCIHTLFERQVADTPDAIAVVFEDQQLTYDELNQRSNQLAHYLVEQGVGPEVRVGLCLERSFEMVIGILGILKAGGAYVPMDPEYPLDRLSYMIEDSQLLFILSQSGLPEALSQLLHSNNAILLDQEWEQIRSAEKQNNVRKREAQAHNLAYVIYTSGSTGKPKGVMVNHQNVLNTLHFLEQTYPVQKNDAYLLKTNYVFDVSLSELFGWFLGPGRLAILPPEEEKSPESMIEHIEKHAITHLNFAPSMLSVFVEEARQNRAFISRCPLKYLMVAGEAFPKPLVKACVELFSTTSVENIYGPTESSIYSAWYSCRQGEVDSEHTPIGRPINNTQLYVVDSHLQPVPIGVAGELCIAGAGLARGYLNRPELTEKAFIDNPFNPSSKLYKTGDVVRYLTDGNIEYIGRVDHQVKVRGFRIELGEIENTLTEQEGIREAIVLAHSRDGSGGNHYLAAYLVHEQGLDIDHNQLRENLKASLPDYMVPSFFIQLDELPLTPNGKVDRKALPIPHATNLQTQEYVAPSTETEKALVDIWAEILNLPANKIGIKDDFFELGGNSISLIRIVSLCRKNAFELTVKEVFEQRTIRQLSGSIPNKKQTEEDSFSLETEIALDKSIRGSNLSRELVKEKIGPSEAIFLTGCTGFVGAFLLKELLTQTEAQIYCLVRADSDQQALSRITDKLRAYDLYDKTELQRIVVVSGDLSKPLFGLAPDKFDDLSSAIDLIVHNGAWVNHLYPYDTLKAANVGGTREILRLATREKLKAVHHISIFNAEFIAEKDFSSLASGPHWGYGLTKYAAEKMIQAADKRNVPVVIHRLGMISGDHRGISNTNDRICLLIKGCIALNCIPDADGLASICAPRLTPVDFVAKAIISLARKQESIGNTHNINNPLPMQWSELLVAIKEMGYDIETAPLAQWKEKLAEAVELYPDEKIYETLSGLYLNEIQETTSTNYSNNFYQENTYVAMISLLAKAGVNCGVVDHLSLSKGLKYLIDSGFVQTPIKRC